MRRFAHLNPVNLTECKSEGALNDAMARWANGSLRLTIGHPACLHPETQVLTERRGWVRIIDVGSDDRVFDGVEFVKHDGCHYSGHKDVVDLFGITMTPNHKLLIQGEWKEAKDVQDTRDSRSQALFQWEVTRQGHDSRRSGRVLQDVELRQESATREHPSERKAHVYDLVNCGPRHRFVIRNNDGEMFISHNSMGHGVDGLQKRGHIVVWFGITWSLDLYKQMNARLRRQGQGVPVICHRIMMRDTLDHAQALALAGKDETEQSLRNAVKEYRVARGM